MDKSEFYPKPGESEEDRFMRVFKPERTEFGHARQSCSCWQCVAACEEMPSFLIPSDLARLTGIKELAESPLTTQYDTVVMIGVETWARQHLLASPGAVVMRDGELIRIPTLVPRRSLWGHCHWLVEGKCSVWEQAPFGCAFFKMCGYENDDLKSRHGHIAVMKDWAVGGPYSRIWEMLASNGFVASPPEAGRRAMSDRM